MTALISQWKLLLAGGAAAALLGLFALWRLEVSHARTLQDQVQAAQAAQKNAEAQTAAASDAEAVVASGAARDQRTLAVHTENSHAIQAAQGAGQSLDPDLNAAGRRGLCALDAYTADPACVPLRGDGSGQRPQAGAADAPAGG
jgi:hypothetical protein